VKTARDGAATVHVLDDDPRVLDGLADLLRSVGYPVRTFRSAADFMASGHSSAAGCLVLDVRLPGLSGLDLQIQLSSGQAAMPVVLMTGHADVQMSVRGMKAGAVDFLIKPFREQDMLDAVAAAMARDAERRAEQARRDDLLDRARTLSQRERQVMAAVVQGRLNKQIAFDLALSEITVKIHRAKAMRKMGARNLVDLVRMADELGPGPFVDQDGPKRL
jgi:FixJ family two-component response regulator